MNKDLVELVFVVDRSGSMQSIYKTAVDGFNQYVKDQSETDGEVNLSIYTFDNEVDLVVDRQSLKDKTVIQNIDIHLPEWFAPRGMTALYDAMFQAIKDTGRKLAAMPEADRPAKVLVVTITDGAENSSHTALKELRQHIEMQTDLYKWDFVFIGANQDSILTAKNLGINPDLAMNFMASNVGTLNVMSGMSHNTKSLRAAVVANGSAAAYSISEEDRKEAIDDAKNS